MSLSPELLLLAPIFRAIALLILLFGVFLMVSGLVRLSATKTVTHFRWAQDRILRSLRRAPETAGAPILQTWFPEEDSADGTDGFYSLAATMRCPLGDASKLSPILPGVTYARRPSRLPEDARFQRL